MKNLEYHRCSVSEDYYSIRNRLHRDESIAQHAVAFNDIWLIKLIDLQTIDSSLLTFH